MSENFDEQRGAIKNYLLGNLDDPAKLREIEKKIMLDDDFAEQIEIAEDELIDEYLDEALSEAERERFVLFFLVAPENKEKVRLNQSLREYAAKQSREHPVVRPFAEQTTEKKVSKFEWGNWFSLTPIRLAAVFLFIAGCGFAVWHAVFYQSDVEKGLAQLRLAHSGERTVEARISGFGYAPVYATRGADKDSSDSRAALSRERAERFLAYAVAENPSDAAALKALGKFYLTEKQFDKAVEQFERAAQFAPRDAELESDWAAALFEAGKKAAENQDGALSLELFNESLKHGEKAVALDAAMLEPLFNRALVLEALVNREQAKRAWQEYLARDRTSLWADEAKRRLQNLETEQSLERPAAELERDFLDAFRARNEERAGLLLRRNRELIREKYLPQRLAMSYLENKTPGGEKQEFLRALEYAGELEKNRSGDRFAAEIARFYLQNLPENKIVVLKEAQRAIRQGYELCLKSKYEAARAEFEKARELFRQAGNELEAKLSDYLVAYCLKNENQIEVSLLLFNEIAAFSRQKNYKWLEMTALYWSAMSLVNVKQLTQAKKSHERALALAEEIDDSYAQQRNLLGLAYLSAFVGQRNQSLAYTRAILHQTGAPDATDSLRQKHRNYAYAAEVFTLARLYSIAEPTALEAVRLADALDDKMFMVIARANAGAVYTLARDFDEARRLLAEAEQIAAAIGDNSTREKMQAYSFVKLGYLERQTGNFQKAESFYGEALSLYQSMKMPFNQYEARKGELLTQLALGKSAELDEKIPAALKLLEDYRAQILEEQERTSFFDTEESIYDIAANYEFARGNVEKSYRYAEMSSSRSLLDWLQKGARISESGKDTKILLEENAEPLALSEIRARMPDSVQILQYSVLDDKVIIWLISKEKFVAVPVEIKSEELRARVEHYVQSIRQKDAFAESFAGQSSTERMGREFYDLLIEPIFAHLDETREICLIPSKSLFYVPFAALLAADGKPLLAQFTIFYSPSANVFLLCTENARRKSDFQDETLLSVGNPTFDSRAFDDLSHLPAAEREANAITAFYENRQTLLGKKATKQAFLEAIKKADVVHFAGHYVTVHNAPLSSFLLLAQNKKEAAENEKNSILTNAELLGEKLPRAKLVVLSACQTGIEHYYNGEGMIGLSRTFLAAGAPLVVASQWSVETEATAELMKRFHYYRRQEKMSSAAALRRAQLEILNDSAGRFSRPVYWASFAVFGGYANF